MYSDIDESVRKTSMSLGLSVGRMDALSTRSQGVANHFASIGLSSTDALEAQMSYNEEMGRTVMLSTHALKQIGDLGVKSGLGAAAIGEMAGQMEQYGMGSTVALNMIEEIRDTAQGMGVNSGKVIKKTQQNFKLLNKLNFKGGVKGLAKMAAFSEKFGMNMESVASAAEKVFSPEGAIEAAANLQMLGGGFSALADPFKLMFDARNDPEKFAEGISNSLTGIAKFKDGEFVISAYELQRLEQAGEALGMSKEEMAGMAKQKAKMDKIGGALSAFTDPKEKALLEGMIEFNEKGQAMIDGESLKGMSDIRKGELLDRQKTRDQQASDALSARKQWEAIGNQMQSTFLPVMEELNKWLEPFTKTLSGYIKEYPKLAAGLAVFGMAVGKVAEWYLKGYQMGLGFNAASEKGGLLKRLKGSKLNPMNWKKKAATMGPSLPDGGLKGTEENASKISKGGGAGSSLKSLAEGLGAMGTPKVLFGAANLIPTSIGMIAMLPALPSLLFLGNAPLKKLGSNLFEMAFGLESMGSGKVAFGALNLLLASVGFAAMTVGVVGLTAIALLGTFLGGGLSALAGGLTLMGTPPVLLGTLALIGIGAAFMLLGAGIYFLGAGIAMIVDSFTNMFSVISSDNIGALLMLGPALMGISLGIMGLGASLLFLAATMAMGGWLGLLALGVAAESVGTAFQGIDANGITQSVDAINNVDMDKINALKELSTAMAVWGMFGSKPIEVHMAVDGQIKLGGSNGETFDISELTPAQVSELKDLIFQQQKVDSTGGYV